MRYAIVALILSFAVAAPVVAVSFPGRSGDFSEVAPGAFLRVDNNVSPGLAYGYRPVTRRFLPAVIPARKATGLESQGAKRASSLNSSAAARTAELKSDVAARKRLLAEQRSALAGLSYAQSSRARWTSPAPEAQASLDLTPAFVPAPATDETAPKSRLSPPRRITVARTSTIAEEVAARKAALKVHHKVKGPTTLGPPPPFRYKNTKLYRSWGR